MLLHILRHTKRCVCGKVIRKQKIVRGSLSPPSTVSDRTLFFVKDSLPSLTKKWINFCLHYLISDSNQRLIHPAARSPAPTRHPVTFNLSTMQTLLSKNSFEGRLTGEIIYTVMKQRLTWPRQTDIFCLGIRHFSVCFSHLHVWIRIHVCLVNSK